MTRAERKAMQASVAVRVLAGLAARNAVRNQIRAQGLRLHEFTAKEITLRAEAWLEAKSESESSKVRLGLIPDSGPARRGWGQLRADPNHDKLALVVMTKERAAAMAVLTVLPLNCAIG